jgi:hypothetical protein
MKHFLFLFFAINALSVLSIAELYQTHYVVILDPSGDAQRTGRLIHDNFERGLTLQCAEKIKEYLAVHALHIKVIITRMPGDIVYDLQNASFANRLEANLFINLNCYYCKETKPTLFLYQFSYGNDFIGGSPDLAFHTYDDAYRINKPKTDAIATQFKHFLSQPPYQSLFSIAGSYCVPLKPLIGIVSPSITCEMGLKNKESWITYVEPISKAIMQVLP